MKWCKSHINPSSEQQRLNIQINSDLLSLTCVAVTSFHKVEVINSFVSGLIKRQRIKCWSGNRQRKLHWLRGKEASIPLHSISSHHLPLLYMQQKWNTTIVCIEFYKECTNTCLMALKGVCPLPTPNPENQFLIPLLLEYITLIKYCHKI